MKGVGYRAARASVKSKNVVELIEKTDKRNPNGLRWNSEYSLREILVAIPGLEPGFEP
jgi:hypothetical protein